MSNYASPHEAWHDQLPESCTCEPGWKDRGLVDDRCFHHRMIEVVEFLLESSWTVTP